jgi:Ca2+-binding RTX toxin-like protein
VHNSGTIVGDIDLGYGADLVSNGGSITGAIYMGQGDDVVETTANGSYHGAIYGGDGNDSLTGGSKHDVIYGDNGQDGGQDGDDDLSGGRGRDSLFGNDGNDNLTGGHGADVLTGGRGRDVFTYTSVQDSSAHHADLITDLRVADTVDLSGVDADAGVAGDQAFTLVDAFDGHAGQLTVSYDAQSGQSLIQADTDGDGAADLVIRANGDQTDFTGFVL